MTRFPGSPAYIGGEPEPHSHRLHSDTATVPTGTARHEEVIQMNQHDIDTVETVQQLAQANAHGPLNTEQSNRNLRLSAAYANGQPYTCPHGCDVVDAYLPLAAQRWGVEWLHEQSCPLHDDNVEPVLRRVTHDELDVLIGGG